MAAPSKIATLDNQYDDDRVLKQYLERVLPESVLRDVEGELRDLGAVVGGELYNLQLADRDNRPALTQWDAQGNRIDHIELTDVWKRGLDLAAEYGLVSIPYAQRHGAYSRIHQFALAHLFAPATDMMGFLLATTDGAARTIQNSGNRDVIDQAMPHLLSRNPETFWTAGQWRTESTGGTDLSRIQTTARPDGDGWRLYGRKWFTSSVVANCALVLAQPEGTRHDRANLALYYLPIRTSDGPVADGIQVNRLKESMGARKLPVSEIQIDGARAQLLTEPKHGTRYLTDMVELARTWNAVIATGYMRRGLALARDYSTKREAFGTPIIEKPLHYDTMASMQATYEGAFQLTFRLVELLGKQEAGTLTDTESHLLRALTPIVKLTTAKQAVNVVGEVLEAFGGAGFVEDTGIPSLLRDVHALPVWEGTTNVMSLIALQSIQRDGRLQAIKQELVDCREAVEATALVHAVEAAQETFKGAVKWLSEALEDGQPAVEAGARRFALTIGHSLELALLARHAQWAVGHEGSRAAAVVEHFATQGIDFIAPRRHYDAYMLARDVSKQSLFQV